MAKDTCQQMTFICCEGNGPSLMMVEWLKGKKEGSILHLGQPVRDGEGSVGSLVSYTHA